jgi:hypothetical protein
MGNKSAEPLWIPQINLSDCASSAKRMPSRLNELGGRRLVRVLTHHKFSPGGEPWNQSAIIPPSTARDAPMM